MKYWSTYTHIFGLSSQNSDMAKAQLTTHFRLYDFGYASYPAGMLSTF